MPQSIHYFPVKKRRGRTIDEQRASIKEGVASKVRAQALKYGV